VRMDIFNFLNLLNKKWGEVENAGFFGTRTLVPSATAANGQYVYNISKPPQGYTLYDSYTNPSRVVSRWQNAADLEIQVLGRLLQGYPNRRPRGRRFSFLR